MEHAELLYIGQWQGFYQYGAEYGPVIDGQEAEFRLFIETFADGQFTGRAIDWDGVGADGEVAEVSGFYDGKTISFTKQYPYYNTIDEWGNTETFKDIPGCTVVYEGCFHHQSNTFCGTWEIVTELEHGADYTVESVATGTWRMHRQ